MEAFEGAADQGRVCGEGGGKSLQAFVFLPLACVGVVSTCDTLNRALSRVKPTLVEGVDHARVDSIGRVGHSRRTRGIVESSSLSLTLLSPSCS